MRLINKKGSTSIRTVFPLLLLVAAMVCVSATIFMNTSEDVEGAPTDYTENGINYKVDSIGGTSFATVADNPDAKGAITIPAKVKDDLYTVTSIGESAFKGCTELTSVTFEDNSLLKSIGANAFYECSNLISITIPDSVTSIGADAFYECSNLISITIPDSVTSIGDSAFAYTGLTSVTIPNSVTSIGQNAFNRCGSLGSVTFGNNQFFTTISSSAFAYTGLTSVTIPNSVTSIDSYAFNGCGSLGSVSFGNSPSLTTISSYAFAYTVLTDVTIPNSVTSIGSYAFDHCGSLGSVTFGNNQFFTTISSNAFSYTGLTDVTIPDSVTSIGSYAFDHCGSLGSVTFGNNPSLTTISSYAFAYTVLTDVTIPDSVTSIDQCVFSMCESLNSVTFGNNQSFTKINPYVFSSCTALTSITIPDTVTSIGDSAFSGCVTLPSITIPNSVTSIGSYVFSNCAALESIAIPNSASVGTSAFNSCPELTSVTISGKGTGTGNVLGTYFNGTDWKIQGSPSITTLIIDTTDDINIDSVNIIEDKILKITPKSEDVTGATDNVIFSGNAVSGKDRADKEYIGTGGQWIGGDVYVTVTISPDNGGRVEGDTTYTAGQNASLMAVPEEGYEFVEWRDSADVKVHEDATYDLRIKKNTTLKAVFERTSVTLNLTAEPNEGGTVEKNKVELFYNDEVKVTATPNTGYEFVNWVTTGTAQVVSDESPYTFNITVNTNLTAVFRLKTYQLTLSVDPSGKGEVMGDGTFDHGTGVTATATPGTGYEFVNWVTTGTNEEKSRSNPYEFNITEDTKLTAIFKLKEYELTLSADPSGAGTFIGEGTYTHGTGVTATATPNEGYSFVEWRDGEKWLSADLSYSFTIEEDSTFTAIFEIIMVDLSVRADPSHQGEVKGSGTYEYGTIVKITATPNKGYKFVAWSDGNENAERSIKLTTDTSLTAYFAVDDPDMCTITVVIKGNGNVYGMGTFAKGTVITLNASPDQGYSFQGWSHTPYAGQTVQLSVESDMVITATFSQNDTGIGGSNTTIDTTTVIIIIVVIVVIFGIVVAASLIRGRGSV